MQRLLITAGSAAFFLLASACTSTVTTSDWCNTTSDCEAGTLCIGGSCRAPCNSDRECLNKAEACVDGVCIAATNPDCGEDVDCQDQVPPQCHHRIGAECWGGECDFPPQAAGTQCISGDQCQLDEHCDDNGNCAGTAVVCDDPPDDSCNAANDEFHWYADTGTCEPTTGTCRYLDGTSFCANCSYTCLDACADIVCPDLEGGCQRSGQCLADPDGAYCEYFTVAPDGVACTRDGDSDNIDRGVCAGGLCLDCSTDASNCLYPPTDWDSCFDARCESNVCVYDAMSDAVCAVTGCVSGIEDDERVCGPLGDCPTINPTTCAPYTCDTAGVVCRNDCANDTHCQGGLFCHAGACIPLFHDGDACSDAAGRECDSGYCANGLCCDASSDACCNAPADCPVEYTTAPACDAPTEHCQGHRVDAVCSANVCGSLVIEDDSGCTTSYSLSCTTPANLAALPCDGTADQTAPSCPAQCDGTFPCDSGYECNAGTCEQLAGVGDSCSTPGTPGDCNTGLQCANSVCCDAVAVDCCTQHSHCDINRECATASAACVYGCDQYTAFAVTGAEAICSSGSATIGLAGSQTGVNYRLLRGGSPAGGVATEEGDGSAISFDTVSTAGTYTVQAYNANDSCTLAMTGEAAVSIRTTTSISSHPSDTTALCPAADPTFSVTASGHGLSYQWQLSTNAGGSWSDVSGATSASYQVMDVTTGMNGDLYRVRVNGTCGNLTSNGAQVNVNTSSSVPSSATSSDADDTVCPSTAVDLTQSGGSLGSGGTWYWYTGSCGGTLVGTSLSADASYNVTPASTTTYYVRAEGTCNTTSCASVTVTVRTDSTAPSGANSSDADNTVCSGTQVTLTQTGGALGSGADWNWYTGSCGGTALSPDTGSSNPNTNADAGVAVSPTSTTTYWVRAEGTCNTTACGQVAVTTVANTAITTHPSNATNQCPDDDPSFTVVATGAGLSYQWQVSTNGGTNYGDLSNGGVYSGVASATLTLTNVTSGMDSYLYRAVVSGSCGSVNSNAATLSVRTESSAPTSAATNDADDTTCSGDTVTLSQAGGSLGSGADWHWYSGSCGGTAVGTSTAADADYDVSPTSTTTYYVRAEGACNTTACQSVTVTVRSDSTAATSATASPAAICSGGSADLTQAGGSLGSGATWHWDTVSCGGTAAGTSSVADAELTVSPTSTTTYYVRAEGTCNTTTCDNVAVTVRPDTGITTQPSNASNQCPGADPTFTVVASGHSPSYQWQRSTNGGTSFSDISGATSASYQVMNVTYAMDNYQYQVVVSSSCGSDVTSSAATLDVRECCAESDCGDCQLCTSNSCADDWEPAEVTITRVDCSRGGSSVPACNDSFGPPNAGVYTVTDPADSFIITFRVNTGNAPFKYSGSLDASSGLQGGASFYVDGGQSIFGGPTPISQDVTDHIQDDNNEYVLDGGGMAGEPYQLDLVYEFWHCGH